MQINLCRLTRGMRTRRHCVFVHLFGKGKLKQQHIHTLLIVLLGWYENQVTSAMTSVSELPHHSLYDIPFVMQAMAVWVVCHSWIVIECRFNEGCHLCLDSLPEVVYAVARFQNFPFFHYAHSFLCEWTVKNKDTCIWEMIEMLVANHFSLSLC